MIALCNEENVKEKICSILFPRNMTVKIIIVRTEIRQNIREKPYTLDSSAPPLHDSTISVNLLKRVNHRTVNGVKCILY